MSQSVRKKEPLWTALLVAGLVAGTLDGTAAVIRFLIKGGTNPLKVFRYIASGAFGPDATKGGVGMALWGILFHYLIAFTFTALFFFLYRMVPFARIKWLNGILYGVFIWAVMELGVLPLTRVKPFTPTLESGTIASLILIVCIGLPVSFFARNYYKNLRP